jgi:hypothetical protein
MDCQNTLFLFAILRKRKDLLFSFVMSKELWMGGYTPEEQAYPHGTKLDLAKEKSLQEELEKQVSLESVVVANILRYT